MLYTIDQAEQRENVKCKFVYDEKQQSVTGTISASRLTCDIVQFSFSEESPYISANFHVTWGNQELALDNPDNIQGKPHIFVYVICKNKVIYTYICLSVRPSVCPSVVCLSIY